MTPQHANPRNKTIIGFDPSPYSICKKYIQIMYPLYRSEHETDVEYPSQTNSYVYVYVYDMMYVSTYVYIHVYI